MTPEILDGVPMCTTACPEHDGKRCRLLGLRPSDICEPAVRQMADELVRLRAMIPSSAVVDTPESMAREIALDEAIHCWGYEEMRDLLQSWIDGCYREKNVSELWSTATGDPYWVKFTRRARAMVTRLRDAHGNGAVG